MTVRRCFVLVCGGGGDPWDWHLVVPRLRERGHEVIVPQLPVTDDEAGLEAYAAAIVRAAGDRRGVVLVAHSMGALSAPLACAPLDAAELLLVAPMIPAPGETAGEWWTAGGVAEAARALAVAEGRDPAAPMDLVETFLHDVPGPVREAAVARGEG